MCKLPRHKVAEQALETTCKLLESLSLHVAPVGSRRIGCLPPQSQSKPPKSL